MSSWLKAAEDLLQKVDQSAKTVVEQQKFSSQIEADTSSAPSPPTTGSSTQVSKLPLLAAKSKNSTPKPLEYSTRSALSAERSSVPKAKSAASLSSIRQHHLPETGRTLSSRSDEAIDEFKHKDTTANVNEAEKAEDNKQSDDLQDASVEPTSSSSELSGSVRFHKMVDSLRKRVDRLQAENEQLEEMLAAADIAAKGGSGHVNRLEEALSKIRFEKESAEAGAASALAEKDKALQSMAKELERVIQKCEVVELQLAGMQQAHELLIEERRISEDHLLQSLRAEVEMAERTLEAERAAHLETRKASAAREQELDAAVAAASAALGPMQRQFEDKSSRLTSAQERVAALEGEVDELNRQLQAVQCQLSTANEMAAATSSETVLVRAEAAEARVHEATLARQKAEAEAKVAFDEVARLRDELSVLNKRLLSASANDSGDLHRRVKELGDMLYMKQTQIERLTADSAAQRLSLERQLSSAKNDALRRRSVTERSMGDVEDGSGVVPMDALPAYMKLAGDRRVGGAVKAGARLLDATANQAVYILRAHPIGRLALFLYFIVMHLFVYLLLHRLQHKAFLENHHD